MKKIGTLSILLLFVALSCSDDSNITNKKNTFLDQFNVIALFGFNNGYLDQSENNLKLNPNSITFDLDRYDKENFSVMSNNISSFIKSERDTILNLSEHFTISVWIKPNLSLCKYDNGDFVDIIGRWSATGIDASSYSICLTNEGEIQGRTYNANNIKMNTWIQSESKVNDLEWNNIIVTRDSYGVLFVYLNGIKVSSGNANPPQKSNYELYFFKRRDSESHFYGNIDDIIILNDYLEEEKVQKLMNINL